MVAKLRQRRMTDTMLANWKQLGLFALIRFFMRDNGHYKSKMGEIKTSATLVERRSLCTEISHDEYTRALKENDRAEVISANGKFYLLGEAVLAQRVGYTAPKSQLRYTPDFYLPLCLYDLTEVCSGNVPEVIGLYVTYPFADSVWVGMIEELLMGYHEWEISGVTYHTTVAVVVTKPESLGGLHYPLFDEYGNDKAKTYHNSLIPLLNKQAQKNPTWVLLDTGGNTINFGIGNGRSKLSAVTDTFYDIGSELVYANLDKMLRSPDFVYRQAFADITGRISLPILSSILTDPDYCYWKGDKPVDCAWAVSRATSSVMATLWDLIQRKTSGFFHYIVLVGGGNIVMRNPLIDALRTNGVFDQPDNYVVSVSDDDMMARINPLGHIYTVLALWQTKGISREVLDW